AGAPERPPAARETQKNQQLHTATAQAGDPAEPHPLGGGRRASHVRRERQRQPHQAVEQGGPGRGGWLHRRRGHPRRRHLGPRAGGAAQEDRRLVRDEDPEARQARRLSQDGRAAQRDHGHVAAKSPEHLPTPGDLRIPHEGQHLPHSRAVHRRGATFSPKQSGERHPTLLLLLLPMPSLSWHQGGEYRRGMSLLPSFRLQPLRPNSRSLSVPYLNPSPPPPRCLPSGLGFFPMTTPV
ncbi:unnamed protein product, partial [Ectocarpus sp. 4 AP-2014]